MKIQVILLIIFVSTLIRSTFGFGDALLAMPLLTFVLGIEISTPLVALIAVTISMIIVLTDWRQINISAAWQLIVASFIGIPFGVLLLTVAPKNIAIGFLGVSLILFGFYRLIKPELPVLKDKSWVYLFGFVAGVLGSAYNTNGPPIVLYGAMRRWSPEQFRATLQGYFLPTGLLIAISHGFGGLWNLEMFRLYLISLPAVFIAIFIGEKLNKYMPKDRFEQLLFVTFIFLGALLLIPELI
jgi:uncharacterized protein